MISRFNKGAFLFLLALTLVVVFPAYAQQPEYKDVRLKIFHLLNLEPGTPAKGPDPLATPTPAVNQTNIVYKGNVVGTAQYSAAGGYQMTVNIPEQFDNANFDYYAFLRRATPADTVRLNDQPLPSFRIQYANTRDLTSHNQLLITQETNGATPPSTPSNVVYQGTQEYITPTPGPTSSQPTTQPTSAQQPTSGAQPTTGQQPTTGPGQPTSGQQGPTIDEQIQAVISAVSEAKVLEYLQNIANEAGQTNEAQTRFSGTSGNIEEQDYMIQHFRDLGYEVDTSQSYSYGYGGRQITTKNIIAKLPGQNVSSVYLVTAHMDSTAERSGSTDPAPGVNDNGSGTVTVMEIARAFKEAQIQPANSVEFILFSGEEQGLHGSKYYANNIPANKTIRAVVNVDMVGNVDPQGDCVEFAYKPGTGGNLITDTIVEIIQTKNIDMRTRSFEWGITLSDHAPFWSKGIYTSVFGHECERGTQESPPNDVYHTTSDKIDQVSVSQIAKTAQAVGGALVKMTQEGIGQQLQNPTGGSVQGLFDEVNAQEPAAVGGTIFAVIPFDDVSELDIFYDNVSTSIDYVTDERNSQDIFLGLFTTAQLDVLRENGYEPRIVNDNANLEEYEFLYHPKPNQGDKLADLGEVFEVAPNYYLVRLAPGQEYTHQGVLGEFFDLTLPENAPTVPFRTATITLAPTPTDMPLEPTVQEDTSSTSGISSILLLISLLGFMGVITVGLVYFLRKKNAIPEDQLS